MCINTRTAGDSHPPRTAKWSKWLQIQIIHSSLTYFIFDIITVHKSGYHHRLIKICYLDAKYMQKQMIGEVIKITIILQYRYKNL